MDAKIAREIFRYDADTGKLYWRKISGNQVRPGQEITCKSDRGYLYVKFRGKRYKAHRVIWLMTYGSWPKNDVDHIDHDTSNNRLSNLRDVTKRQNHRNLPMFKSNTSGVTGVSFYKRSKKWVVKAYGADGKQKHIGYFADFDDAVAARDKAYLERGYHQNHGLPREVAASQ